MTQDGDAGVPGSLARVLGDVAAERAAQDEMWGMQELPDGTGGGRTAADSGRARQETETAAGDGTLTWRHILAEEVLEAFAEADRDRLRAELVQVAAVAVKWIQSLDRRPAPADRLMTPGDRREAAAAAPGGHREAPAAARGDRFRAIVDVHVMLVRGAEILLARRAGTGYGDGLWHLPSGHLEEGEAATAAAVREAAEEVGVTVDPADLTFVHVMHRAPERVGLFFTTGKWIGEPCNAEPHKCSEIAWWPMDALPDDMVDYPKAAIAKIVAGVPFAEHDWSTDH
ncbi:NUDIX hydrolase [Nonomuraea sp. SYSU D8015]|uniref:NUDIX hydrolase n=1 Tax=Nonomuraea sp. SYSU D8015 TaxID=2593644 RepID=UPI001CB75406|nr:NUDIX domain-containing protein [Nonomuraea sp. SYSU D8015]